MDYEKAYKAVLQTATQWIKDGCTDKERICLESVFPELRESEDERKLQKCIKIVERWEEDYDIAYAPYSNLLKSLRPQPHWKPSEEQIQGLAHAINLDVYDAQRYKLDILYNDLKKLM